jgi:hypothetical protein
MPQSKSEQPPLQMLQVGGMDERSSISTTPNGAFRLVQGLYPNNLNAQQRIPGKSLFALLTSPVWNIYQTFDNNGTIIVQTQNSVQTTTLDALFGRTVTPNLTPATSTEEDTMAYALIIHKETAGTAGGALNAAGSANIFYTRKLTTKVADASSFVSLAASPTNQFSLGAGTYRFTIDVVGCNMGTHVARLYNITDTAQVDVGTQASSQTIGTNSATYVQTISRIETRYTIASGTKVFEIQQSASNVAGLQATVARGFAAGSGVEAYYLLCKIIKE